MKLADIENKINALEGADAKIESEIAALENTDELIRRGKQFCRDGEARLALKCFLRAGKLYEAYGYLFAAQIFGNVLCDGYAALYLYRRITRCWSDGTAEQQRFCKISIEEFNEPLEWQYPYKYYLEALREQARIFRYGLERVPADGRKAVYYYKRIVKSVLGTFDTYSLCDAERYERFVADATNGNYATFALHNIGNMYRDGEAGLNPNRRVAERYYHWLTNFLLPKRRPVTIY